MTTETRAIRSLLLAAVGSLLLAVNAQATLVSLDLSTTGDGRLTLDTLTGLEWLDLTATTNQSLSNLTPEQVYKSGQGGGALIIDKFNKQGDGERNR